MGFASGSRTLRHDLKLFEVNSRCPKNPLTHLAPGPGQVRPGWPSFLRVGKAPQERATRSVPIRRMTPEAHSFWIGTCSRRDGCKQVDASLWFRAKGGQL